jgi:hypothetical protein
MATTREQLRLAPSYEGDFYGWALQQAQLLRARRFDLLDLDNLAEEVEDLARRHADALQSRFEILVQHLLKWEFQPSERSHGWAGTIRRERGKIARLLEKNPGLKPRRFELFAEAFDGARAGAAIESDLPFEHFPEICPYTLDQAMDPAFWPGGEAMPERSRRGRHRKSG